MKNIKEVAGLLNITEMSIKRLIDPSRSHRSVLDDLGCYKHKEYLFSDEGVKYIAYQYMSKSKECFYYVYPNKKPTVNNKPVKKTITKKMFKQIRK